MTAAEGDVSSGPATDARASLLTPIERTSLADEVTSKLRIGILTGTIRPGERIREQEISAAMKTSRGPVRDALVQLEHEGLVVREPNRSATVVQMTAEDLEEVHSLRLSLELLALRYVIERAGEDDFARLLTASGALRECLENRGTLQEAVGLDLGFHEEFVKAAHHQRVLSMWQSIRPQVWFLIFSRNAAAITNFQDAIGTHGDLMDALRRRDLATGTSIIRDHLHNAYLNVLALYPEAGTAKKNEP